MLVLEKSASDIEGNDCRCCGAYSAWSSDVLRDSAAFEIGGDIKPETEYGLGCAD